MCAITDFPFLHRLKDVVKLCIHYKMIIIKLVRLLFKCYKYQKKQNECGQECWALTVKAIFSMGFGHV